MSCCKLSIRKYQECTGPAFLPMALSNNFDMAEFYNLA